MNLVRIPVRSRNGYESLISSGRLGMLRNRLLARQIQVHYGNHDELLDTQTTVFRPFRNDGALARDDPGFAAYLRSQREWGTVHDKLLASISRETTVLLAAIEQKLSTP